MTVQVTPFQFDRVFSKKPVLGDGGMASGTRSSAGEDDLRREIERLHAHYKAELDKARMDGFQTGLAQARAERDSAVLSAVDAVQLGLETMREQLGDVVREMKREVAGLALDAAEAIAGHAIQNCPLDLIVSTLHDVVDQVVAGTAIEVIVHPEMQGPLQAALQSHVRLRRREPDLAVVADDTVEPGDARLVWRQGGVELSRAERADMVRTEIEAVLQSADPIEPAASSGESAGVPLLRSAA